MATYYIDPDTGTGTGVGSEADPFAAWSEVTWAAGNSYLQKRGTTTTARINIATSGSEINPVYLGAYGIGAKPKVVVTAEQYCIFASQRPWIIIEDFDVSGGTAGGITLTSGATAASECKIRRCTATDCNGNGVGVIATPNMSSYPAATGIVIEDCEAHDCGAHGVHVIGSANGAVIRGCKASNCSSIATGWGIYISPRGSVINTPDWTAVGDGSFNLTTWTTYASLGANEAALLVNLACTQRTSTGKFVLTQGTFGSLAADEWAVSGTTLQVRLLTDESPDNLNVITNVSQNQNAVIENCRAWNMSDAFDGHGMGFDHMQESSVMRGCTSFSNPKDGINFNVTIGCTAVGNLCHSNLNGGISITTTDDTLSTVAKNNTCDNNTVYGIYTQRSLLADVSNNILTNNGTGLDISADSTGVTNTYNCNYGNTATGDTDATDVLTDPQLDANYVPASTSPCVGTGVKWWTGANPVGADGEPFADFETDIGGIQSKHSAFHPTNLR